MNPLKYLIATFIVAFIYANVNGQHVGIGQVTPTHTLHITPVNNGDDPIRIDGLNYFNAADTSVLIMNSATGVVKYINPSDLKRLLDLELIVENGLSLDAVSDKIKLGGLLTEATTVTNGAFDMIFNLNDVGNFHVNTNATNHFSVLNNGRTVVGGVGNAGTFNVNGTSFFSDDLYLKDGSVNGLDLVRIYDNNDDGQIDVYQDGTIVNRISGQGDSYINGGFLGLNTGTPAQQLDVEGTVRLNPETHSGADLNRIAMLDDDGDIRANSLDSLTLSDAVTYNISGKTIKSNEPVVLDLPNPSYGRTVISELKFYTTCDLSSEPITVHFKRYGSSYFYSFSYALGNETMINSPGAIITIPVTNACGDYTLQLWLTLTTNTLTIFDLSGPPVDGFYLKSGETTILRWQ